MSAARGAAALRRCIYRGPMMTSTVPVQHASQRRPNALRITPALRAMAAVMNDLDPEPEDLAVLAETTVSVQTLHLAAAVALRQVMRPFLLSRSAGGAPAAEHKALMDAYYLAVSLAQQDWNAPKLRADQLESALLIGAMQVRFLESVCEQVEISASTPQFDVGATIPARTALERGGHLGSGVQLLADHTADSTSEGYSWLHAVSTITVAGISDHAVVDAGPDNAPVECAAQLAAPVTVVATTGFWPVTVVEDCLRICAPAVREWVAAMPRELCGEERTDLLLRHGSSLRNYLVSPATAALTGDSGKETHLPIRPRESNGTPADKPQRELAAQMRVGGVSGDELGPDVKIAADVRIAAIRRDELTLLAAVPAKPLSHSVEVTVNFALPEWKDLTGLLEEVREAGGLTLTGSILGWIDRDVVEGQLNRVSLRARVHSGVVCDTTAGQAVLLPEGATFTLLGADTTRVHTTLYGVEAKISDSTSRRTRMEMVA